MEQQLVIFLLLILEVSSYRWARKEIPNGQSVPDPYNPGQIWQGVGHRSKYGAGLRNVFGKHFYHQYMMWTKTLCLTDSDGDGRTNGQELGDAYCTWTRGSRPSGPATGHPGICEPVNSTRCIEINEGQNTCLLPQICEGAIVSTETEIVHHLHHLKNSENDIRKTDIRFRRINVSAKKTNYFCQLFGLPSGGPYHITADRPLLDNGEVLHHMLLYACPDSVKPEDIDGNLSFHTPKPCGMMVQEKCSHIIAGWTVCGTGDCYDGLEAATRIGQGGFKMAVLEVHWNNPEQKSWLTDSPGFRLFYTTRLRKHDQGLFTVGPAGFRLPGGQGSVQVTAQCPASCMRQKLRTPINVIGAGIHMHLLGRKGYLDLIRSNGTIKNLASNDNFDYNSPVDTNHPEPVVVNPGDSLRMRCVYDTREKSEHVYYGPSTYDEMCYSYVSYYPKINDFTLCLQHGETSHCDGQRNLTRVGHCDLSPSSLTHALGELISKCDSRRGTCSDTCSRFLQVNPCFHGDARIYIEYILGDEIRSSPYIRALRSCDDKESTPGTPTPGTPTPGTNEAESWYDYYWYAYYNY